MYPSRVMTTYTSSFAIKSRLSIETSSFLSTITLLLGIPNFLTMFLRSLIIKRFNLFGFSIISVNSLIVFSRSSFSFIYIETSVCDNLYKRIVTIASA